MYDVIGDVHGQGEKLRALLREMGYAERADGWHAPAGGKAVFVGDLIDRGPEQIAVLEIVRSTVERGHAMMVLGNHELNAIGYATIDEASGNQFRPRSAKNRAQHARFLEEVGEDSPLHREWVEWFRTQPLALDLDGIRVVHGWWDQAAVEIVDAAFRAAGNRITDEFLKAAYAPGALMDARKILTCGVEMPLPEGVFILDKMGGKHGEARMAVWRHWAKRLPEMAIVPSGGDHLVADREIPPEYCVPPVTGAPILFGHHWFSGPVKLETPKVACLDWSAAKDGPLVAYRWDGESELRHENLVWVGGADAPQ